MEVIPCPKLILYWGCLIGCRAQERHPCLGALTTAASTAELRVRVKATLPGLAGAPIASLWALLATVSGNAPDFSDRGVSFEAHDGHQPKQAGSNAPCRQWVERWYQHQLGAGL